MAAAAVVVVVAAVSVYAAAVLGDQTGKGAGCRVPVATAERLLPDDVLRGARFPVGGRLYKRRDGPVPNGHAYRVRSAQAVGERGGVRAVAVRQPATAVDYLGVGHGVLGRSGGGHVFARAGSAAVQAQRRHDRDAAVPAAVAVGGHRGVHVRQFGGRAGVPVGASRRTVARPVPGPGGRGARVVRVLTHVRRALGVPVFHSGRRGRRRWLGGRRVLRVRRRFTANGRLRARSAAGYARKSVRRDRTAIRRPAATATASGGCQRRHGATHSQLTDITVPRIAFLYSYIYIYI